MKNRKLNIFLIVVLIICIVGITFVKIIPNLNASENKKIKYVFLFIGDGMNINHVELTEIYNNIINGKEFENQEKLSFDKFKSIGLRKNYDKYNYVPDSASSGTAISSGLVTKNGMLNVDDEGAKVAPITYDLKNKRKMKIGILTTVPIVHATPAAFYAYSQSRTEYYSIANDLVNSNFDYFGDGGFNLDENQLKDITNKLNDNKYKIVTSREEIENLNKNSGKVVAINPNQNWGTTKYLIDSEKNDLQLKDFVRKGIDVLDNENGFFMMAESGMIDYASHNDDVKGVISEVNVLDDAVKEALKFYKKHPKETLIIVTGDHETGGLALGNNEGFGLYLSKLQYQKYSLAVLNHTIKYSASFDEVLSYLDSNYGIGADADKFLLTNENKELLSRYYDEKNYDMFMNVIRNIIQTETKVGWTSYNHTASPIAVYAKGVNSDEFSGKYTTKEFNQKLRQVLK